MDIERLRGCGELKQFNRGEYICRENENGNSAFIVLQGTASVVINKLSRTPQVVGKIQPGGFVGEMSLFLGLKRTANVIADCNELLAIEIKEADFKSYLRVDPDTCFKLLKTLHSRISDMLVQLTDIQNTMRFTYQTRQNRFYQLAGQITFVAFYELADNNPDSVLELLKAMCELLNSVNLKYKNI